MKRIITLALITIVVAGFLGLRPLLRQEARLVVENESGEQITNLSVTVSNRQFALGTIASGEKKEVKISEYSDGDWQISGQWADGTPLHEQVGYITHGMSFDDRAVIGKDRKLAFHSKMR